MRYLSFIVFALTFGCVAVNQGQASGPYTCESPTDEDSTLLVSSHSSSDFDGSGFNQPTDKGKKMVLESSVQGFKDKSNSNSDSAYYKISDFINKRLKVNHTTPEHYYKSLRELRTLLTIFDLNTIDKLSIMHKYVSKNSAPKKPSIMQKIMFEHFRHGMGRSVPLRYWFITVFYKEMGLVEVDFGLDLKIKRLLDGYRLNGNVRTKIFSNDITSDLDKKWIEFFIRRKRAHHLEIISLLLIGDDNSLQNANEYWPDCNVKKIFTLEIDARQTQSLQEAKRKRKIIPLY